MYIGRYNHTIDTKNRLFIPSILREKSKLFILTQGLEGCLFLYDMKTWEKVLTKLENLSLPDKTEERAFKRALLSGAHELYLDTQGRVLIPKNLKDFAKIKRDAVIVGVGNRIEIWDEQKWKNYSKEKAEISLKKLAVKLEL
ncbi:MAG: division/cell wall cluster transcriptional repressor MraZ [Elusimicrobia bacterium]|nr:division/cell wall cluster transcriptional repressor MraZ [Candidatus Liberimonas magnetica]